MISFHIIYRTLFEKIFPILSMTEMKGNFYSNFTNNLGFAILAFYDKKLVKNFLDRNKEHKK